MKPSYTLLTLSTLAFTLGLGSVARADDTIALSFDLTPTRLQPPAPEPENSPAQAAIATEAPLPVPATAAYPPLASPSASLPAGVYGGGQALALSEGSLGDIRAWLPAPPPLPELPTALSDPAPSETLETVAQTASAPEDGAVTFELDRRESAIPEAAQATALPSPSTPQPSLLAEIFAGGADSLVARAVGSAEGTRTPTGQRNSAYFGHVDPGNGAWNLGTFSYQHGATSPEEADARQLARLQSQTTQLQDKARTLGVELTLEELLNGIDLANQAPMAALDRGGYVEWLAQARKLNMSGAEAIVWARTRAFLDPDTQQWNAPGLGNNIASISHDQSRRAGAIARALTTMPLPHARPEATSEEPSPVLPQKPQFEPVDIAFALTLPQASFPHPAPEAAVPPVPAPTPPAELSASEAPEPDQPNILALPGVPQENSATAPEPAQPAPSASEIKAIAPSLPEVPAAIAPAADKPRDIPGSVPTAQVFRPLPEEPVAPGDIDPGDGNPGEVEAGEAVDIEVDAVDTDALYTDP